MTINTNMNAIFSNRIVGVNNNEALKINEKLSTGLRINRAGDDASGLAVSEKMRSQIRGLNQASKNVVDGVSFVQVAEGHMQSTTDILHRIRELAVQSSNGIYSDEDRNMLAVEISQLVSEIDRIASQAQFNGMNILTGRFNTDNPMTLHVGANMDERISVSIGDMSATSIGLRGADGTMVDLSTADSANATIGIVDEALSKVLKQRADLGGFQSRLEVAVKGIDIASENMQAAESRIRDADYAQLMVESVRNQVLTQASVSTLAQSNNSSGMIVQLLNSR
jgi:flagellin